MAFPARLRSSLWYLSGTYTPKLYHVACGHTLVVSLASHHVDWDEVHPGRYGEHFREMSLSGYWSSSTAVTQGESNYYSKAFLI